MNKSIYSSLGCANISGAYIYMQVACFSILYAIWILPNTILIRNICLILGALIGLYQIFSYRKKLKFPKTLPLLLLLALFVWITFHLFFLGDNYAMQLEEYQSVWKRSFMVLIFAYGLGVALTNSNSNIQKISWRIFYLGLLSPTLIYLLKFTLTKFGGFSGLNIPAYWLLHAASNSPSPYYVAKTAYMGFCTPVLAIALGQLFLRLKEGAWFNAANFIYIASIFLIFFVFYQENIKNGVVYGFLFLLTFIFLYALQGFRKSPISTAIFVVVVLSFCSFLVLKHIQENPSWKTFSADAKIAIQVDIYPNWKCGSDLGYPKNDFGQIVSTTNYERIAWGISAARLIIQYPLGYGLVERSFRQHGNNLWPGSCLSQSHSGWIDLILGIGIPGFILLISSILLSLKNLNQINLIYCPQLISWKSMLTWGLICFLMIWCTTEISQKVFLEELIFFTALAGGIQLGLVNKIAIAKLE